MNQVIKTKHQLMDALIERASFEASLGASPMWYQIRKQLDNPELEWPAHLLPGYLIQRLTPEQRELLKSLAADDLDHRLDYVRWFVNTYKI